MSSIYYGDAKYDIPDFGDKSRDLRSDADKAFDEKLAQSAAQKLVDDERAFALSDARETYNALEPSGPAWSPNDSQFYTPENIPGSEDTALLPVPSVLPYVLVLALILYYSVKGK